MIVEERMRTYINSLDMGNTPFLEELEKEALSKGVPIIRREMQSFIKVLLAIKQPKRILEVGTAVGFSTLLMCEYGRADLQITTIENYEKRIPIAKENFQKAGQWEKITFLEGDAGQILKELKGSYDLIVPKFQKFAKSRGEKDYFVRGTFTRNNLDFADDVLHFADLGFEKMSIEPVVAAPEEPYSIREEDLPKIMEEYDKLAKEYIKRHRKGKGFTFFHFMLDLNQGPCVAKRLSGCGSGTEYLAVTPWGDFYPCHQFVGIDKFLLGNVDEGITHPEICNEFKLCNVYAKDKCRDCFARFYCSGGCAANSYNFHGSITDAYDIGCEMQKKRIECSIMIKAALADESEIKEKEHEEQ